MQRGVWFVLLVLLVVGCSSAETTPPSNTPQPVAQATATNTPDTGPTATLPPAIIATRTPAPAPPTLTSAPTDIPPTATATAEPTATFTPEPEPTATEIPTEEPTAEPVVEGNCLPRSAIADTVSPFAVVDGPWPRGSAQAIEIYTGNTSPKLIHIGFDVEGSPEPLAEILDILDRHNVKTTMFILGAWADAYPEWVQEFAARGHEFANHTRTHGNLGDMTYHDVQAELNYVEALVQRLTNQTTKPWLRPPFGSRSDVSIQASADAGWTTIVWSGSPDDWRAEYGVEEMCRTLLDTSYPGGILYSHTGRPEMPEVLDRYIGTLQAQGYTFVPLSVIMSSNPSAYLIANE